RGTGAATEDGVEGQTRVVTDTATTSLHLGEVGHAVRADLHADAVVRLRRSTPAGSSHQAVATLAFSGQCLAPSLHSVEQVSTRQPSLVTDLVQDGHVPVVTVDGELLRVLAFDHGQRGHLADALRVLARLQRSVGTSHRLQSASHIGQRGVANLQAGNTGSSYQRGVASRLVDLQSRY